MKLKKTIQQSTFVVEIFNLLIPKEFVDGCIDFYNLVDLNHESIEFHNEDIIEPTAFAFLCMEYLHQMKGTTINASESEIFIKMDFENRANHYYTLLSELDDGFIPLIDFKCENDQLKTIIQLVDVFKRFWKVSLVINYEYEDLIQGFYTYILNKDVSTLTLTDYYRTVDFIECN